MASDHPGGLTRDHVVWAYRLLLDRDPESDSVIAPKLAGSQTTADLRRHLITSAEFRDKNPDFAHTNDRTVVITEVAAGARLFVDLSDHVIGLAIVRGQYERAEVAWARARLKAGDIAVDVGAHIGFFTMQMAVAVGPAGGVYAFEPLDANADLLERSIAENRFEGRVLCRRAAVGATAGTATLTFADETLNTGGAYLLPDATAPLAGNRTRIVPLVALDQLEMRRPIALIKMDVEGAEPQVVRGAARILAEDRPVILSELHRVQLERASGTTPEEVLALMRGQGYRAEDLAGNHITRPPADDVVSVAFVHERN